MTCRLESEQKRQVATECGAGSDDSSPVITQERVMGSLRSSISGVFDKRRTLKRKRVNCDFAEKFAEDE
jgi:hypothetical protein